MQIYSENDAKKLPGGEGVVKGGSFVVVGGDVVVVFSFGLT